MEMWEIIQNECVRGWYEYAVELFYRVLFVNTLCKTLLSPFAGVRFTLDIANVQNDRFCGQHERRSVGGLQAVYLVVVCLRIRTCRLRTKRGGSISKLEIESSTGKKQPVYKFLFLSYSHACRTICGGFLYSSPEYVFFFSPPILGFRRI